MGRPTKFKQQNGRDLEMKTHDLTVGGGSPAPPGDEDGLESNAVLCINDVLTDDSLRAILSKLPTQNDKDKYGLVCKRWLHLQSMDRQRLSARAGPHMLERIALRFTHLLHLDLSQSVSRSYFPGVVDSDLRIVASSFPLLEGINLCQCKEVTDLGLEALGARTSTTFLGIDITDCGRVTDKGVEALVRGCSGLQFLCLNGCKLVTDRGLEAVGQCCKHLVELRLQRCNKITDKGLSSLSKGCKFIRMLDVSMCSKIASSGVQSIAGACSGLRSVNLCGCSKVGNEALQSLAEGCTFLERVKLNGCRLVADEGIIELVTCCGSTLKELDLGWLNVSDAAVSYIFSLCPTVEDLNLESCSRITDNSFTAFKNDVNVLRVLNLRYCPGITNVSAWRIANSCTQLQTLDLRFCGQIDPHVVKSLSFPDGFLLFI